MNNEIEKYQKLLDKLELTRPVPEEVQRYAMKSGDRNLKAILKKTGYYSVFFGILLTLFRWIRSLGINATIFKSKIVLTILSANLASAVILGSQYIAGKYMLDEPVNETREVLQDAALSKKKDIVEKRSPDRRKTSIRSSEIGIQPFSGDSAQAEEVTSKIASYMSKSLGKKNVAFIRQDRKVKLDRVLMGSVRSFGDTRYITARIVNVKNSSVEFVLSEQYKSEEELNAACLRISRKIAEKMRK